MYEEPFFHNTKTPSDRHSRTFNKLQLPLYFIFSYIRAAYVILRTELVILQNAKPHQSSWGFNFFGWGGLFVPLFSLTETLFLKLCIFSILHCSTTAFWQLFINFILFKMLILLQHCTLRAVSV